MKKPHIAVVGSKNPTPDILKSIKSIGMGKPKLKHSVMKSSHNLKVSSGASLKVSNFKTQAEQVAKVAKVNAVRQARINKKLNNIKV